MLHLQIFTDASVNIKLKSVYGAYLVVFYSDAPLLFIYKIYGYIVNLMLK